MEHLGTKDEEQEIQQQADDHQIICNNCWNPSEDGGYLCRNCEFEFDQAHKAVLAGQTTQKE